MTKGTKWIIPYSLTTPPQPPTKIAFSWGPVSRHPSNGGELGAFPSRSNFPFTTDEAVTPIPSRNKVLLYGRIWLLSLVLLRSKFPSAEGWHEVPGWFNPHRPGSRATGGGELSPKVVAKGGTSNKNGASAPFLRNLFRVAQYFHRWLFTGDNIFVNYDFGQIFFLGRFEHRFQ